MPDIHTRDAVYIRNLNGYTAIAYPPLYIRATNEHLSARFEGAEFSKEQAELLAQTIAPQLFPEEGTEPWRKPIREVYADLAETVQSYTRDLSASKAGGWDEEAVTESLSSLLDALNGTLDKLEGLL